jgi:hypothetical protein
MSIYRVELLSRVKPAVSMPMLLEALKRRCRGAVPIADTDSDVSAFAHTGHPVEFSDGTIPAQTLIGPRGEPAEIASLEDALQQSWEFPAARERVNEFRPWSPRRLT